MSTKPTTQPVKLIPQEESAPRIITTTSGPITTVYDRISRFGYSRTNGNTNISYYKKLSNFHENTLDLQLKQIPNSIQVLLGLVPGDIPKMLKMLNDKSDIRSDDERRGQSLYDSNSELNTTDKGSQCGISIFDDPISGWSYQYSSNSCGTNKLTPYGIRAYRNIYDSKKNEWNLDLTNMDKDIPKSIQGLLGIPKPQPQQQVQVPKNNNTTYKILLIVALVIILILSGLIYLMSQK
jgi:hypothetical protein